MDKATTAVPGGVFYGNENKQCPGQKQYKQPKDAVPNEKTKT